MALISKEEAYSTFKPYFPLFMEVFNETWKQWLGSDIARRMFDKRVRAIILRNDTYYYLNDKITNNNVSGIKYVRYPHQAGFLVGDNYFIRIKKGDKNYRSSNYPTQSALDFHDPEIDMFGGVIRLELLYVLAEDGVGIDRVLLTQRNGKYVAWAIDIGAESVIEFVGATTSPALPLTGEVAENGDNAAASTSVAKSVVKRKSKDKKVTKVQNGRDG